MKRACPTPAQLRWQNTEMGMFFHFGLNTFHDQEWGEGKDPAASFHPSELDCEQWVLTAKQAGFRYVVLTAKHHDGFCLWPTKTTPYSVANSPLQEDVVRLCADACRKHNLHFGLYLSPWDRNQPCYSDKVAYDAYYIQQLTELMTGYGELFEVWFDGAGSQDRIYDWENIMAVVQKYQPNAMVFNMGRPTIRWVGNEDGLAPETCWNTAQAARESMYTSDMETWLPDTSSWVPAECDVPIRKLHWFWHPEDEASLRTIEELTQIYEHSVGRGTNLLLNLSPDNRGLLPASDVERVIELGDAIAQRFAHPIAQMYGRGYEILLDTQGRAFDCAVIMEDIAHGEIIESFAIDVYDGAWREVYQGTSVGHKRIVKFSVVSAQQARLRVITSCDIPEILQFAVYQPI